MIVFLAACTFVLVDEPCTKTDSALDSATPACEPTELFPDADGDGFGALSGAEERCETPGWVAVAGDCDDTDKDVFPGALERCNGASDACDAGWVNDDGLATLTDASGATDVSGALTGADGAPASATFEAGNLAICAGTWFVNLQLANGGCVLGLGSPVLDGGHAGTVLSLSGGDYELSDFKVQNGAGDGGGGISVSGAGVVTITNLQIEGNSATLGGGLYVAGTTTTTVTNSTIASNESAGLGGGIALFGDGESKLLLVNSTITANHSVAEGGGVYVEGMNFTCDGELEVDGIGVLANASDAKDAQIRVAGPTGTVTAETCDLASGERGDFGIVSVEGGDDYPFGSDATFSCDATGCVTP